MRVKILSAPYPSSIENEINSWLRQYSSFEILDIKYAVCGNVSSMWEFSALITYRT